MTRENNKMRNADALTFFGNMAANNPTEKDVRIYGKNDFSAIDTEFIVKFITKTSDILDLASGTGLIINKLYHRVRHIVAIEKFKAFSNFIIKSENVDILNDDIMEYESSDRFDLITMFGVVHYFNEAESIALYTKYKNYLKKDGRVIIKNQFGIHEDVNVCGFSEELQESYYSQYRHIEKETKILTELGYRNIEVFDIYPPECNRWDNTHFYAIVAEA